MEFNINIKPLSYYMYLTQNKYRKYITKKGRVYKEEIEKILIKSMEDKQIINEECKIYIEFYFDNKRKNDVDNFTKPILDFMSGIVYEDDKLVVDLHIKKFFDKDNPRILITCRNSPISES